MFVPYLVFVALLGKSACQSVTGIPRYIQGQWIKAEEYPQYEGTEDQQALPPEETVWPENTPQVVEVVTVEDRRVQPATTTPTRSNILKEQVAIEEVEVEASSVWKIVLVVVVLLVSALGVLSVGYYMCVWRGGRIHYQQQKGGDA